MSPTSPYTWQLGEFENRMRRRKKRPNPQRGWLRLEREQVLTAHLPGAELCLHRCLRFVQTYEAGGIIITQIFKIRKLALISQRTCPSSHS